MNLILLSYIIGIFCAKYWLLWLLAGSILFGLVKTRRLTKQWLIILCLFIFMGWLNCLVHPQQEKTYDQKPIPIISQIKTRVIEISQKTLPPFYADLYNSVVFGICDGKAMPEIKEEYRKAGVSHLLVASGMQLSLICGLGLMLVKRSQMPMSLGVVVISLTNVIYSMLAGAGPSILRSLIMCQIMLLGLLLDRRKDASITLGLSGFLLLLYDPNYLFDAGFQLSFCATWALIYLSPLLNNRLKLIFYPKIAVLLSCAIAPYLATLPVTIYNFCEFSSIGIITNLLLLPWVEIIVILGFISTLVGMLFYPLAMIINNAILVLLFISYQITSLCARIPFSQMLMIPPKWYWLLAYYCGLAVFINVLNGQKLPKPSRFKLTLIVLVLILVITWDNALSTSIKGLEIDVLDVGQGDAIFIRTPSNKTMLLDCGEEYYGKKVVLPYLLKHGIKKLDLTMFSHFHSDHVAGFRPVLSKIGTSLLLGSRKTSFGMINYHEALSGQRIDFHDGVTLEVIYSSRFQVDDENQDSVVVRLTYKHFSMLFCGDADAVEEKLLLGKALRCDVLKVGHHGAATSTSDELLNSVQPKAAIISCGRHNKFRHPHRSTLTKLISRGISIFRTDKLGTIVIKSNGATYSILSQH